MTRSETLAARSPHQCAELAAARVVARVVARKVGLALFAEVALIGGLEARSRRSRLERLRRRHLRGGAEPATVSPAVPPTSVAVRA